MTTDHHDATTATAAVAIRTWPTGTEGRAAAGRVLLCAAAQVPSAALADSCTPPPPSPTTAPLAVTCKADAMPSNQRILYSTGPHAISVTDGVFDQIHAGDGDDTVHMTGGTVFIVSGNAGDDTLTLDGGVVQFLTGGPGSNRFNLNGGTVGVALGGAESDEFWLDGAATVTNFIRGEGGAGDKLFLTGTGTLDGAKIQTVETLQVESGAVWTYTGTGPGFSSRVRVNGSASLTIATGASVSNGTTAILNGGFLAVDGDLAYTSAGGTAGFLVAGTLSGNGTVTNAGSGALFGSAMQVLGTGVIRPGTSIGTLTLASKVTFLPGSRLIAEVDPVGAPNADLLAVTDGVQGVNDLTIVIEPLNAGADADAYVAANNYLVLTGTTLDGDTPTLVEGGNLPALVDVAVVGTPSTSGQIALAFTKLPPTQIANQPAVTGTGNPNHSVVAGVVGNTPGGTALANGSTLTTALNNLTNNGLAAFNMVHAEAYSSHLTVMLEQLDLVTNAALDHASGIGFPIGASTPWGDSGPASASPELTYDRRVWGHAAGTRGDVDGDDGLGDFDYTLASRIIGADVVRDPAFTAGVFGSIGWSGMTEHDLIDQELDTTSFSLGGYGRYHFGGGLQLSGAVGYIYAATESERNNPNIGNFTGGTAEADFSGHGVFGGVKLHKTFDESGFAITPYGSMTFAYFRQGEIRESGGGDFNYAIDKASAETFVTAVGVDVSYPMAMGDGVLSPVGILRYEFDWMANANDKHDITVTSPFFGTFAQVGQNRGAHGVLVGIGVSYDESDRLGLGLGYVYANRSGGEEHGLAGNVTVRW